VIQLSSTGDLLHTLATARTIDARAYVLPGSVVRALQAAAERGARVTVRLEGRPHADPGGRLADWNRRAVNALQRAGADAGLGDQIHAKTITADGVRYLDDRNWCRDDLILRDTDPNDPSIPMTKGDALKLEGDLLKSASSSDRIIVATESFGTSNPAFDALLRIAGRGMRPRLLVNGRESLASPGERCALNELAAQGVRIRTCSDSEKFAVVGNHAWIGSANATAAFGRHDTTDWGLCTGDATIVGAVSRRIETQWCKAKAFVPGGKTCN
jgi:hypothetical protein